MADLATLPKYESYKDSGVEWLGVVPKHWDMSPLCSKATLKSITNRIDEELLSVYLDKGVIRFQDVESKRTNVTSLDLSKYQLVEVGDFVLNNQQAWRGSVGVSDYQGIVSPAYLILKLSEEINPRFGNYYFRDGNMVSQYLICSKGVGTIQRNLYWPQLKRVFIVLPPIAEQTAIANFLDKKTTQIDEAISIKEKQIELLKERKQIIIQQAVTQGLDPDVPMKDSGVDWIGKIPEHWDLSKLKYYIDILPGYAFKSELYSSEPTDTPLLRGVNVSPGFTKWNEVVYWSENKIKGLEKFFLEEGDLVIAMDRPWVSSGIRVAEIKKADLPCLLLQRVGRIRGNKHALTAYIKLLLSTDLFLNYFGPMLTGISVPHISAEQIEDFCAPIPPVEEQERILEFLNLETAKHDQGISSTQQQIEKLKEYKTTLINSAVTGKIKVPGVV